jgi:ADP-ribose pyrophosphatase YjhB (NUDIX family)
MNDKNEVTVYSSFLIQNKLTKAYWINKRINPQKAMFKQWQSGGGHIEENETPIEAVIRELKEETGLVFVNQDFELQRIDMHDEDAAHLSGLRINYVFKVKTNKVPQNTEKENHSKWRLCPKEIIKKLISNGTLSNIQHKGKVVYKDQVIDSIEEFSGFQKDQEYQQNLKQIIQLYQQICRRNQEAVVVVEKDHLHYQ